MPSGEPFTCQAARPLEGGRGIQLLRVLAVRRRTRGPGRLVGDRVAYVPMVELSWWMGEEEMVDCTVGGGHADRGQAGRGRDDVDGRAGAVGLGQAAGRLLGRGAARRRGVGGRDGGLRAATVGEPPWGAASGGPPRGGDAGRRGARVVERGGGDGGLRVGRVEGAAQAGRRRLRGGGGGGGAGSGPPGAPRGSVVPCARESKRTRALSQRDAEGPPRAPGAARPRRPRGGSGRAGPGSRAARPLGWGAGGRGRRGRPSSRSGGLISPRKKKRKGKTRRAKGG